MNHYKTLKLTRKAKPRQIRKAFRRLALKWEVSQHPHNKEQAEKMLKKIHAAYSVLSDPVQKHAYDAQLDKMQPSNRSPQEKSHRKERKASALPPRQSTRENISSEEKLTVALPRSEAPPSATVAQPVELKTTLSERAETPTLASSPRRETRHASTPLLAERSEEKRRGRRDSDPTEEQARQALKARNWLLGRESEPTQKEVEGMLLIMQMGKQAQRIHREEEKEKARRKALGQQLIKQVRQSRWDNVQTLVEEGAFLNECDEKGLAAIHYLTIAEDDVGLRELLRLGADINAQDATGKTPLHIATLKANYTLCQFLVAQGATLHQQTYRNKDTPLHLAIENKLDQRIQDLFIRRPSQYYSFFTSYSSLDVQDLLGNTPLHLALRYEQFDTALYLVQRGAKTTVKNRNNQTAWDVLPSHAPRELQQVLNAKYEEENQSGCLVM